MTDMMEFHKFSQFTRRQQAARLRKRITRAHATLMNVTTLAACAGGEELAALIFSLDEALIRARKMTYALETLPETAQSGIKHGIKLVA